MLNVKGLGHRQSLAASAALFMTLTHDMKMKDPDSWIDAVEIDRLIRKLPRFKNNAFLHKSGKPLEEIDFNEDQLDIDHFLNEWEGMCGV